MSRSGCSYDYNSCFIRRNVFCYVGFYITNKKERFYIFIKFYKCDVINRLKQPWANFSK